jgi:hypothetical protein
MTTDVPEHADLQPKAYWDRRARGLGASRERPAVSCGEENLLDLDGDPYATENILIHELSHAVHLMGLPAVDPTFDGRLRKAFAHARDTGLWAHTYAMANAEEYWAEGAQSWFDTNRTNDSEHGPIATRAQLVTYDTELAALLAEVYGDGAWRYRKPRERDADELAHFAGLDRRTAPRFEWPAELAAPVHAIPANATHTALKLARSKPPASPRVSADATSVMFVNHRADPVIVEWVDFDGGFTEYATIAPGQQVVQQTYAGHVWQIREGSTPLGHVTALKTHTRVDIP